jgi:diacylglycerol kinase family enzyme
VSFAISLALGRHHMRRDVVIKEAVELTIRDHPALFVQTDGDPWLGARPATCRLAPEQIQVLIPAPPLVSSI